MCYITLNVTGNVSSVFRGQGGKVAITIREIARRAGVSISTASRALNGRTDVSKEARERVLAVAQELHYTANPYAQALVAGGSRTLGLLIGSSAAPFLNVLVSGILDAVAAGGYSIIVYNTGDDPVRELQAYDTLRKERVIGILVTSVRSGSGPICRLVDDGIPFVLANRRLYDLDTDYVIGDLRQGLREVVGHLYGLGHRRIAHLAGDMAHFPVRERVEGYREALAGFGIPFDPTLVLCGDGSLESFYRLTREGLSALKPRPTAVFTYNDLTATAVLQALAELGWRVPQDISVVGYDDMDFARYLAPPLTTMDQPAYAIGQASAQLLIERLELPEGEPWQPHHVAFRSDLVVRQSTAAPPAWGNRG